MTFLLLRFLRMFWKQSITKYSKREYRATASWRHLVYYELQAKVYSGKGIIQSIHSTFQREHWGWWDKGEIVCILRRSSYNASIFKFSGKIVLVFVHRKKNPIASYSLLLYSSRTKNLYLVKIIFSYHY